MQRSESTDGPTLTGMSYILLVKNLINILQMLAQSLDFVKKKNIFLSPPTLEVTSSICLRLNAIAPMTSVLQKNVLWQKKD